MSEMNSVGDKFNVGKLSQTLIYHLNNNVMSVRYWWQNDRNCNGCSTTNWLNQHLKIDSEIDVVRLVLRTGSCFVRGNQVNYERVSEENIPKKTSSSRRKKYLCQSVNHYDVKYLIEDLWLNQKLQKQTQLIHIGSLRTKPPYTNSSSTSTQLSTFARLSTFGTEINSISKLTACFFQCSVKIVIFN